MQLRFDILTKADIPKYMYKIFVLIPGPDLSVNRRCTFNLF